MRNLRWLAAAIGAAVALSTMATAQQAPAGRPARPAGWGETTHGRSAADYERLFAMDRVHEIRITIAPDHFKAMQDDVATVSAMPPFGLPGRGGGGADPDAQFAQMLEAGAAACSGRAAGAACALGPIEGQCNAMFGGAPLVCQPAGFGPGRGGRIELTTRDPMYVPVTVEHDGRRWTKVGMRYKGNSSLAASIGAGNGKLPFRLHFDRYEDEAPEIRNQRFYGFQELTFSSNFSDDSQLREVLANEVFRDLGIPAPRAAFYRVFVDTGGGAEYWGLYTLVEDPSDGAMLEAQFGTRDGNLYKPDGPGADWTRFDPEGFEKKTNEAAADFSDVRRAIEALHATAPPDTWRAGLERVFDVELFLRWLAANTAIGNWDAYGGLAHNYYLYADAARGGQLRWIPWDNNFAFGAVPAFPGGPGGGRGGFPGAGRGGAPGPFGPPGLGGRGGPGGRGGLPFPGVDDVLHRQVGAQWPLIQRLLADPVYQARYRIELERAFSKLMAPDAFARRARELHALITPAVVGPQGERASHTTIGSPDAFQAAVDGPQGLVAFVSARERAAREALRSTVTP